MCHGVRRTSEFTTNPDVRTRTTEQFEQVKAIVDALEELERDLEDSLVEERRRPDDTELTPVTPASADD